MGQGLTIDNSAVKTRPAVDWKKPWNLIELILSPNLELPFLGLDLRLGLGLVNNVTFRSDSEG